MQIALITDTFPPLCTSGAVQLRDLARELICQDHEVTVMLATHELKQAWQLEEIDGIQLVRIRTPRIKDIGYIWRTIGECLMPFIMLKNLRKTPLKNTRWDGVVWYSPSIFHGPLAKALKKSSSCKGYLIVRDIFPEWAVDMGLMGRGLPYHFFSAVARYQYSVADIIGVQTQGNCAYFAKWAQEASHHLEVLQNWLANPPTGNCSIQIAKTSLAGRKVFLYAGNMGVAQDVSVLIDLAERMRSRADIGFLFVGRGSEAQKMATTARERGLDNILFFDEIQPDEVPGLCTQCHVGLVALDHKHKSHNIPGKFITYMRSYLPVLAQVNAGNDLACMIRKNRVGLANEDGTVETLERMGRELLQELERDPCMKKRCHEVYQRLFTPQAAVQQIVAALTSNNERRL